MTDQFTGQRGQLTVEQRKTLALALGDRLQTRISAVKADFNAAWEARAKLSHQIADADKKVKELEVELNLLLSIAEALSW